MSVERIIQQLQQRVNEPIDVTLTDNMRRMLSMKQRDGVLQVRMHHMFSQAGTRTLRAIARYIATRGEDGREVIQEYVRSNDDKIRPSNRRVILRPNGEHFELEELRDEVCEDYFPDIDPPHITWGRTTRGRNKRSIQFASYDPGRDLVRVNPKLDASFVPEYFIKYLIYHEILHRVHPPRPGDVHTADHQNALSDYPRYKEAERWQRENLHRFVRAAEKMRD